MQFAHYLGGLLHGDLGRSDLQKSAVAELIAARLPTTLLLMLAAIFCEQVIGLTMGIVAALKRDRFTDQALMMTSFVTVSAPQFVVSLLMRYVLAAKLSWFLIGGYGTFRHLMLPAVTLGVLGSGWYCRMMRSSMVDVMRTDHIRTARAKSLTRVRVVLGHALPNAILPIIAMIGIDIGVFMGGIVVVESDDVSKDGLTFTFHLGTGVKFTNGREMTADDGKYTLDRVTLPATQLPGAGFFQMIKGADTMANSSATSQEGVKIADPLTVEIILNRPDATFLQVMALNFSFIVPNEVVEAEGADSGKKPVGTGAFKLAGWILG